ncbi:MAG TPA: hypothetical protein VF493_19255 [Terriglobales bacterium]
MPPNSVTETYVAWKLHIQNWRWAGVPFCLRTGKRMPENLTQIVIQFKQPPLRMFDGMSFDHSAPNLLTMRIQPDEGVSLKFAAKVTGPGTHVHPMSMDAHFTTTFGMASANAYERLLLDCMLGDATLFAHREEVELAWELVTPILEAWKHQPARVPSYPAGTWGPTEAESLPEAGHRWRAA